MNSANEYACPALAVNIGGCAVSQIQKYLSGGHCNGH